ncbi:ECF sigma factor [Sulfidibacter corallicola]|uniref:RNA polymerase sigma-70 ECF-like HTH domain-containing protein n=1 Tax=Sulfidibacter corallicola TaxID=2818388 RepID=A0A8A4TIN6_SULCO|nr:ECF-type sigma factor [Sulfidibacter corallicola]QTD49054.1 hypothetical protein J3U87_26000 [Sulfidibacter corallicola]
MNDSNPERKPMGDEGDVTCLLRQWQEEGRAVFDRLWPAVADDLKHISLKLLSEFVAGAGPAATMSATDLLHEAFPKLYHYRIGREFQNRAQFFALAKSIMLHILLNYRRKKFRAQGHLAADVELADIADGEALSLDSIMTLLEGLRKLATIAPRQSRIIHMRFYQDMSFKGIMAEMGMSRSSVYLDLKGGLLFLKHYLQQNEHAGNASRSLEA